MHCVFRECNIGHSIMCFGELRNVTPARPRRESQSSSGPQISTGSLLRLFSWEKSLFSPVTNVSCLLSRINNTKVARPSILADIASDILHFGISLPQPGNNVLGDVPPDAGDTGLYCALYRNRGILCKIEEKKSSGGWLGVDPVAVFAWDSLRSNVSVY